MSKGTYIINHNGELTDGNKPAGQDNCVITVQNRAFRYGDLLFESIALKNGRMPLLPLHIKRLLNGCAILKMKPAVEWDETFFQKQVQRLVLEAGMEDSARIRLSLYRSDGGLYAPENNSCEFLIEAALLPQHAFSESMTGLNVSIYTDNVKTPSKIGSLKSGNALLYVLASIAAKENEMDDMLLLNEGGSIVEATGSNVFYYHEDKLCTPPLSDGCVNGVMREYITTNTEVTEKTTTLLHLAEAEEIFLSNATLGIRPVAMLKNKSYPSAKTQELAGILYKQLWE
jgi:branched-chain amino acid aminotransferase